MYAGGTYDDKFAEGIIIVELAEWRESATFKQAATNNQVPIIDIDPKNSTISMAEAVRQATLGNMIQKVMEEQKMQQGDMSNQV